MRALNIGITIGLRSVDESLWVNGIKQNALFLAQLLSTSPRQHEVFIVNTTDVPVTSALAWDPSLFPTRTLSDVKDRLDVLIELGGQINEQDTDYLKQRGTRLVSYCCGFEYTHLIEGLIANRTLWPNGLFINQQYDQLWVIPQIANNSLGYLQTLRRCPAKVVPFVWNPIFLEQRANALANQGIYRPRSAPARLSIMEPNINTVKTCIYPIMIAEQVYRQHSDDIGFLHVCNAQQWATERHDFELIMNQLDIVRAHKAAFVGRYDTAAFLSEHTDIVISHQWDNPLNYFYFDVCWLGYPLIHNADLCPDLGYYYPQNDIAIGSQQLIRALQEHDAQHQTYLNQQRERIRQQYTLDNPQLIAEYDQLLDSLFCTD